MANVKIMFKAANASYFGAEALVSDSRPFVLRPYSTMVERFKQVLRKGDRFLIELLLRQATYSRDVRLPRKLLKELVKHASKVSGQCY